MAKTVSRKSSELQPGNVVCTHGMRVRIDEVREIEDASSYGGRFHACPGTVLNVREAVEEFDIPAGFLTTQKFVDGQGWVTDRNDSWTIQGNDLATWAVEA